MALPFSTALMAALIARKPLKLHTVNKAIGLSEADAFLAHSHLIQPRQANVEHICG